MDTIFPRYCLGCGVLVSGDAKSCVCRVCLSGIKIKKEFSCAFCRSPAILGATCRFCKSGHSLDRLFVATSSHQPLVDKIIKTLKYHFVKDLAGDVTELMIKHLEPKTINTLGAKENLIIVPVPLSRRRLNWRGFNQAELIATELAKWLGVPCASVLARIRNNPPQAKIVTLKERVENAKNTFDCREPAQVLNKKILLIDDISTSGSTINDCARALKAAGATEVAGFVAARGTGISRN